MDTLLCKLLFEMQKCKILFQFYYCFIYSRFHLNAFSVLSLFARSYFLSHRLPIVEMECIQNCLLQLFATDLCRAQFIQAFYFHISLVWTIIPVPTQSCHNVIQSFISHYVFRQSSVHHFKYGNRTYSKLCLLLYTDIWYILIYVTDLQHVQAFFFFILSIIC